MVHNILIGVHALAGMVCFAAGVLSFGLSTARSARLRVYLLSLTVMLLFLIAVISVDWPRLSTTERLLFSGLILLGLYMLWRGVQARNRLRRRDPGWRSRYLDDIGFTLIALFDGFVIIAAIDLGAPGWLVGLVAVLGVAGGILAIRQIKARYGAEPTDATGA